jgi:hypothetical protein
VRRVILLGIVAIALAYLYILALVYGIGVNAAQRVPAWWSEFFSTRPSSVRSWVFISHAVVVLLVSMPFAWVVVRAYGRFSVRVSAAIAIIIWGLFEAPLMRDAFGSDGAFPRALWLADTIQFIGSLPLLVLLFRRLPSNNRFERSQLETASLGQGGGR